MPCISVVITRLLPVTPVQWVVTHWTPQITSKLVVEICLNCPKLQLLDISGCHHVLKPSLEAAAQGLQCVWPSSSSTAAVAALANDRYCACVWCVVCAMVLAHRYAELATTFHGLKPHHNRVALFDAMHSDVVRGAAAVRIQTLARVW